MVPKSTFLATPCSQEEKQRAESLAISLQEQKRVALDLEEQLSLPPEQRQRPREDCQYKSMVLDFIGSLNIPDSFKVIHLTRSIAFISLVKAMLYKQIV